MVKTAVRHKGIGAVIAAVAVAMVALFAMSACQTKTEVETNLTPKLSSGTTITDGTLTVGINASNSPYGGTNNNNETVGLDVDVAAALADELGMKLQIVDVNSDGRSALSNKQVDMVLGATKSGDDKTVTYTSAYINDGASLFCLQENAPKSIKSFQLGNGKILAQSGTASAYAVQESLGSQAVQTTSTLQDAFQALESGEQKYLVADAVIGDYFARNYSGVQRVDYISASSVAPMYGMTLTSNRELTSQVDQALDTISQNGVLRTIVAKWLGSEGESLLPGKTNVSELPQTAFGSE